MVIKKRKNSYYSSVKNYGYIFILPSLIVFSIFLIYPMLNSFYLSLFNWNLITPKIFIGLNNFRNLFIDTRFLNSFKATGVFTGLSVLIIVILSFWFALAFTAKIRNKNILQSLIFLPVIFTMVAVAIIWKFMFQSTGILSYIFLLFGLKIPWLTSSTVAPYAMIIVYVWKMTGFYMVIFLAGLLNIPEVYYEAAEVDGAGFWQRLIYITIPQLKNTIILVFISCTLLTFGAFEQQYVMTEGGPARSTEVLGLLIYKEAFSFNKFGYASAISVVYFLTLLIFAIAQLRIFRSENK
jgi:ABC-type sugar transport system permease subunit